MQPIDHRAASVIGCSKFLKPAPLLETAAVRLGYWVGWLSGEVHKQHNHRDPYTVYI